jgi:hypothetical protein
MPRKAKRPSQQVKKKSISKRQEASLKRHSKTPQRKAHGFYEEAYAYG